MSAAGAAEEVAGAEEATTGAAATAAAAAGGFGAGAAGAAGFAPAGLVKRLIAEVVVIGFSWGGGGVCAVVMCSLTVSACSSFSCVCRCSEKSLLPSGTMHCFPCQPQPP